MPDWVIDVTDETKLRGERVVIEAPTEEQARDIALQVTPVELTTVAYIIDAAEPQVPPIVATVESGAFDAIASELVAALSARIADPEVVTG